MLKHEVVTRRRWLNEQEFLDLLGAANLIPGPNSTELAIHIGFRRGGWPGLVIAGLAFILPATVIVAAIAWAYVRFNSLPEVKFLLYGIKPIIFSVVIHALVGLGKQAVKSFFMFALLAINTVAYFFGVSEILLLFCSGSALIGLDKLKSKNTKSLPLIFMQVSSALPQTMVSAATTAASSASNMQIFWIFMKIGSVLYGSGYVLIAFLRSAFIEDLAWLTEDQLLDAIAVGQITPGPVFTTATFIGYLIKGFPGATAATIGIFLPAFLFVAISAPFISRLRESKTFSVFLDGVNIASLALMIGAAWQLADTAFVDPITVGIGFVGLLLMFFQRTNPTYLILSGGLIGILIKIFLPSFKLQ